MVPDCEITVRVTPRSSRNKLEATAEGIKVWVTAAPTDGQANEAVTKLLAKTLGIAPSKVVLKRGDTSRVKTFALEGITQEDVHTRINS